MDWISDEYTRWLSLVVIHIFETNSQKCFLYTVCKNAGKFTDLVGGEAQRN